MGNPAKERTVVRTWVQGKPEVKKLQGKNRKLSMNRSAETCHRRFIFLSDSGRCISLVLRVGFSTVERRDQDENYGRRQHHFHKKVKYAAPARRLVPSGF